MNFAQFLANLKKRPFISATLTILSGNVIAQIIMVLSIPVITRLYEPDIYGRFGIISAMIAIISSVATLRYHVASLLPKSEDESESLVLLSILNSLVISIVLLVIIFLFNELIAQFLNLSNFSGLLYFVPLGTFLTSLVNIFNIRSLRKKQFKKLSLSKIGGMFSGRLYSIGFGFFNPVSDTLVIGQLLQLVIIVWILLTRQFREFINSVFSVRAFELLRFVAARYKEYMKYCLTDLLILLTQNLPIFLLGTIFTPQIVGLYTLNKRVLNKPSLVVGSAIQRSFYRRILELKDTGPACSDFVHRVFNTLVIVTVFPMVAAPIFISELFTSVFGNNWDAAAIYAIELIPLFGFTFMLIPSNAVFDVYERQKERLFFSVLFLLAVLTAFLIGGLMNSPDVCLILFSVFGSTVYLIRSAYILKVTGVSIKLFFIYLVKTIFVSFIILSPLYVCKYILQMGLIALMIMATVSSIMYFYIFYRKSIMHFLTILRGKATQ